MAIALMMTIAIATAITREQEEEEEDDDGDDYDNHVACGMQKYSDSILRTGKYLNVILQCEKTVEWPEAQSIEYLPNPESYRPIIEKVVLVFFGPIGKN